MTSGWRAVTVEQIAANGASSISIGPFGSRMKSDCYADSGVPVVRGNNISGGKHPEGEFVFITEAKAAELKSSEVTGGDLVFPHRGAIGRVALIPEGERMILSSSMMKLTPNKKICQPSFLLYFFRSGKGIYELLKNASTVGTPGIGQPLSSLKRIPVDLPPLQEQKAIAHILGTLDDKIELNRKTNETLEAMAKALFKSWFVDFDPVRAKAEGRPTGLPAEISNLFPDSFEDSELGQIPSGWTYSRLGEISEWRSGSTPSKANPGYWGGSTPWISATSMKDPVVFSSDDSLSDLALESGARLAPEAILLLVRGSGLHTRIAVCLVGVEVAFNQDVKAITARSGSHFSSDLILAYFNSQVEQLLGMVEFTGIGAGKLDTERLQGLLVADPGQHLLYYADRLISSIYRKIGANLLACQALSEMRDTLLPKLISGELRVPDAEKLLAEVGV
jgi:type I restriction enzyme S subunit